jgi:mannose-6-phosphate isomerase-like protein (cupin superfamily)
MAKLQLKRLDSPDETRSFKNGKAEVVTLGGVRFMRMTFQPGWRWSKSVKPIVKTESCQNHHVGYMISGRMKVVMDKGKEMEFTSGDGFEIPPGHDAWVVGKEPAVGIEFVSAGVYAKPAK